MRGERAYSIILDEFSTFPPVPEGCLEVSNSKTKMKIVADDSEILDGSELIEIGPPRLIIPQGCLRMSNSKRVK